MKCMRGAGLSIEILIEYINFFRYGNSTIKARKKLLIDQRSRLAEKIKELGKTLERLGKKIMGMKKECCKRSKIKK